MSKIKKKMLNNRIFLSFYFLKKIKFYKRITLEKTEFNLSS